MATVAVGLAAGAMAPSPANASPWWNVFFTEGSGNLSIDSDYEARIADFMSKAQSELNVAGYTWGCSSSHEVFNTANDKANNGLTVKFIGDGDRQFEDSRFDCDGTPGEDFTVLNDQVQKNTDPAGDPISHSKFIIRDPGTDNAGLIINTNNWTEGGHSSQPGMMVIIQDFPALIDSFKQEFEERFGGTWHGGVSTESNLTAPTGELVESYFSPEDDPINTHLVNAIEDSTESVYFMALLQTNENLSDAAATAKANGSIVEGLTDDCGFSSCEDVLNQYWDNGVDVREDQAGANPRQHHKTYVIDLEEVMVGSANHTVSASSSNDENITFFNDPAMAREVMQDFHRHFDDNDVASNLNGEPTHEDNAPSQVTSVSVSDVPTSDDELEVSWEASPPSDFNRYYVFIDSQPIQVEQNHVGNNIPSIRPEVATITDPSDTSVILDSINDGDALSIGQDYYVGVTMTDDHANEATLVSTGPVSPQPAGDQADPRFDLDFADGASNKAGASSQLRIEVANDTSAENSIKEVQFDMQSSNNSFLLDDSQSAPENWNVNSINKPVVSFTASSSSSQISPGDSLVFHVNVTNPADTGSSADVLGTTVDDENKALRDLVVGNLNITQRQATPGGSVQYATDSEDTRAGRTSQVTVNVTNAGGGSADITEVTFNSGSDANTDFRFRSNQTAPTGWTIGSESNFSVVATADDTSFHIGEGESQEFTLDVRNPRGEGTSNPISLSVLDSSGNTADTTLNGLAVRASEAVVLNEFMYSPDGEDDDFEWIELYNLNVNSDIEIGGWDVTVDGETFSPAEGTVVPADGFLVFANDVSDRDDDGNSFGTKYNVSAEEGPAWLLDNEADQIALTSTDSTYSVTLNYDVTLSSWGSGADNTGRSFEKIDPEIRDIGDPSTDGNNWQASAEDGGTPKAENSSQQVFETHTATAGDRTISTLDGTQTLREEDVVVDIDLVNEPSDPPVLYYDADQDPDGPGGSTSDESVTATSVDDGDPSTFRATIPRSSSKIAHGVELRYLWDIDDQIRDNAGSFYRFSVDGQVSAPSNLSIASVGSNSVTLTFDGIDDSDFQQYDVFFSETSPVTASDQSQSFSDQFRGDTGVTVSGLADETTYNFNLTAVDNVGNTSPLDPNDEVSATTKKGFEVTVNRAEDGVNAISTFDGSAALRDNDWTVHWEFDESVEGRDVSLYYDILDSPDGEGGSNTGDRERLAEGSDTTFQAVIPSFDDEFESGRTVEFVVQVGDQTIFSNEGNPFAIQIGNTVDPSVDNFRVTDEAGGKVTFRWDVPAQVSDFKTYRIFYADTFPISGDENTWDESNDVSLGALSTTQTTVENLEPNKTYYFRIAVINEIGSVGPLSDRVQGRTNTKNSVLITEMNINPTNGHDSFVELTALEGPIDISDFRLTDMDGSEDTFAADPVTLQAGERAVVHPYSGTQETDETGDLNGNGVVDLYTSNIEADFGASGAASNEVLVLYDDEAGDTIDALVYREDAQRDFGASVEPEVNRLAPNQWDRTDSAGAVITYAQSGKSLDDTPAIARKTNGFGELRDSNSKSDWEVTTNPTPGAENTFLEITDLTVADSPSRPTHQFKKEISSFRGEKTLKPTTSREFTIQFNQPPIQHDRIEVTAAFDRNPRTSDASESLTPDPEFDPNTLIASGFVDLTGDSHGAEERVMIRSHNVATSSTQYDFLDFKRNGQFYRYQLDNLASRDDMSGLTVQEVRDGEVTLTWDPLDEAKHPDFQEYLLFMDTGTVTRESREMGRDDLEVFGSVSSAIADVPVPEVDATWNFRMAAVDVHGNISDITKIHTTANGIDMGDFSDTATAFVGEPIALTGLTATDDTNTVDLSTSDGSLQADSIEVTARFDRSTDTRIIHWNTTPATPANPDSSADIDTETTMSKVTSKKYRGELPPQADGTEVSLAIETDGENFDRTGDGYQITIDDTASVPISDFAFGAYSPTGSDQTDITVAWEPISKTAPAEARNFDRYQVVYDTDLNLSDGGERTFSESKDSSLGDSRAAVATVKGLASAETYAFGVRWVDQLGNVSTVSDTFDTKTINGEPTDDPVFDGNRWATQLDGSEYLRAGQDYRVRFRFFSKPENTDNVQLIYNALGSDQVPFDGKGEVEQITLHPDPDDSLVFEGIIESSDPGISTAEKVAYYVRANGLNFNNSREYFRFNLDDSPVDPLSNLNTDDYGDYVSLYWNPTSLSDFETYRIRYRKSTAESWTTVDKTNNTAMGNQNTGIFDLPVESGSNYLINMTVVDQAGWKAWQEQNLRIKRTENFAPVLEVEPDYIKLYPDEEGELSVYLEDLDGQPWSNQTVKWTKIGGPGSFVNSDDTSVLTTTDGSGQTAAGFSAGSESRQFTHFRLSFPDSSGVEPVTVGLYTVPSEYDKSNYRLYTD